MWPVHLPRKAVEESFAGDADFAQLPNCQARHNIAASSMRFPRKGEQMPETCVWTGTSSTQYPYYIFAIPPNFNRNQNGNYIYAKVVNNAWSPIYIGQGDLRDRTQNHHQAECIARKGSTHVHAHLNEREAGRKREETDLLANYPQAYAPTGCNERVGG
jgi:hypothetical protein